MQKKETKQEQIKQESEWIIYSCIYFFLMKTCKTTFWKKLSTHTQKTVCRWMNECDYSQRGARCTEAKDPGKEEGGGCKEGRGGRRRSWFLTAEARTKARVLLAAIAAATSAARAPQGLQPAETRTNCNMPIHTSSLSCSGRPGREEGSDESTAPQPEAIREADLPLTHTHTPCRKGTKKDRERTRWTGNKAERFMHTQEHVRAKKKHQRDPGITTRITVFD